ncbi:ATP-binding protein [Phaeodactylibacter sp.]|uniref:ATP-binding protein n=1 Tax=Phaeodactylibacter sp. TaxID=1940289 RepID=UPI0032F04CD6
MKQYLLAKKYILLFLVLLQGSGGVVFGAVPASDSLEVKLEQAGSEEERINLLFEAAELQLRTNSKEAIALTRRVLELSGKDRDTSRAKAYKFLQQAYLYQGQLDQGLLYNDSLMYLYSWQENHKEQAWGLRSRGYIFLLQGEYNQAYEALLGALDANRKDYDRVMEFDIKILLADVLTNLREFKDTDSLYRISIAVLDSLNRPNGVAFGHIHRGIGLQLQDKHEQALHVFREGKQYAEEKGISYARFSAEINMGWSFAKLEQADSALYYCSRGLKEYTKFGDTYGQAHCCKCIGYAYFTEGLLDKAAPELLKALELYTEIGVSEGQNEVLETLATLYEKKGNMAKALQYHKAFKSLSDSLLSIDRSRQITFLQTQFDVAEHKRSNARLQEKLHIQNKLSNQYMGLWLLALGLLAALFFLYRLKSQSNKRLETEVSARTRELRNSNEQLQLANQELRQFAYITSHDMKEPVRNISRFATLIQRRLQKGETENIEEFLQYISRGALQLDELIKDVYSFTQLDELHRQYTNVGLGEIIGTIKTDLDSLIREKNGTLAFEDHALYVPEKPLKIVLKNLLENAWKYNENEEAVVQLSCTESTTHYTFRMEDNGIGIPKEYDEYVFKMFKRLNDREQYTGSGLGLSIVKKLVQKMGGNIRIERPGLDGRGIAMVFTIQKQNSVQHQI